jgi:transposase-like protein
MRKKIYCPCCNSTNCKRDYVYPSMDSYPEQYTFVCDDCKKEFVDSYDEL